MYYFLCIIFYFIITLLLFSYLFIPRKCIFSFTRSYGLISGINLIVFYRDVYGVKVNIMCDIYLLNK